MTVGNTHGQTPRKTEFQAGYKPVLIRAELKKRLQEWQSANGLTDSHYQRCLVSAFVELGLDEGSREKLFQILASSVQKDFELSCPVGGNEHSPQSSATPARSLKSVT